MKHWMKSTFGCFVYLGLLFPNLAIADPSQKPSDHRAPLRLAQPEWKPLTAQQIREKISDRSVVIDETYETLSGVKLPIIFAGGCPPHETFFSGLTRHSLAMANGKSGYANVPIEFSWAVGLSSRSVAASGYVLRAMNGQSPVALCGKGPASIRFSWLLEQRRMKTN